MDLILKYWAQITVLIGIISYGLRGYWEFKIKKMEMKSTLVFKERIEIISKFYSAYIDWQSYLKILIGHKFEEGANHVALMRKHLQSWEDFRSTFHKISLFIPPKNEDDFREVKLISIELHKVYLNCSEKNFDYDLVEAELETLSKKANKHLEKIIGYFKEEFMI